MKSTAVENSIAIGAGAHATESDQVVIRDEYGTILCVTDARLRAALDKAFHEVGVASINEFLRLNPPKEPLDLMPADQIIMVEGADGEEVELTFGEIVAAGDMFDAITIHKAEAAESNLDAAKDRAMSIHAYDTMAGAPDNGRITVPCDGEEQP